MFSSLIQGSPFYVISKGEDLKYEIGQVESYSQPRAVFPNSFQAYSQHVDMVIDCIKVRFGDDVKEYPSVPAGKSIHSYNNGSVIITDSKDAAVSEIENIQRNETAALAAVPVHERLISRCGEILKELNPRIVEDAQRDEKLDRLEKGMEELRGMLASMMGK